MAEANSDALSLVSNQASQADSLASVASNAASACLTSLHTYESALSDATSEVKASAYADFQTNSNLISSLSNTLSATSNLAQANSAAISDLDNDAVSILASTNIDTTQSQIHVHYDKITLADGTTFSCVTLVDKA